MAQYAAVLVGGGVLGFAGAALNITTLALSLPGTEFGFLIPAGGLAQVVAASTFAGAAGALLGSDIGAVVRGTGGAVGAVLVLVIAPPLIVQLATEAAAWIPNTLNTVASSVTDEVSVLAALAALAARAIVPAPIGLVAVQRRDVV